MSYDFIIFDTANIGYRVFNNDENIKKDCVYVGSKRIYRKLLKGYSDTIDFLTKKFLSDSGELVFLYDNYTSKEELRKLLVPLKESDSRKNYNPDYKSGRKAAKAEFYNTLDTLRYYFLVGDPNIHTVRIPNLEADDLVKPCIALVRESNPKAKILLVTNDSDWCRYLDDNTQYLPDLYKEPVGKERFLEKYGYEPTEESIILYKTLYGDDADNIKAVFPEFDSKMKKFIMDNFKSVLDFMFEAPNYPELKPHVVMIKDREVEIKIAYQMLSAIPVSDSHFRKVYTTGRNSPVMKTRMRMIFEDQKEEENKFTFGGAIPRYNPKGR